jgi:hypothetical protein
MPMPIRLAPPTCQLYFKGDGGFLDRKPSGAAMPRYSGIIQRSVMYASGHYCEYRNWQITMFLEDVDAILCVGVQKRGIKFESYAK